MIEGYHKNILENRIKFKKRLKKIKGDKLETDKRENPK